LSSAQVGVAGKISINATHVPIAPNVALIAFSLVTLN
jgi:hypothetical protein